MDEDDLKIKYIFERSKLKAWKPTNDTKSKVRTTIMHNKRNMRRVFK